MKNAGSTIIQKRHLSLRPRDRSYNPYGEAQDETKAYEYAHPLRQPGFATDQPSNAAQWPHKADHHAPEQDVQEPVHAELFSSFGRPGSVEVAAGSAHATCAGVVIVDPRILHRPQAVWGRHRVRRVSRRLDRAELQPQLVHLGRREARAEQPVEAPRAPAHRAGPATALRAAAVAPRARVRDGRRRPAGDGLGDRRLSRLGLRRELLVRQRVADAAVDVDALRRGVPALDGLALALGVVLVRPGWRRRRLQDGGQDRSVG